MVTEAEILAEWEARYGTLSTEKRARFLEKGGHVRRLVSLPDDAVREAIFDRRRLDEIEILASGKQRQRRPRSRDLGADERHPSDYGSVTINRPGRPEHVVDLGFCDSCGIRLTPDGRCACSQ